MSHLLDEARLAAQRDFDARHPPRERNRRGQFATPPALALALARAGLAAHGPGPLRFLDPALGTGALYAALAALGHTPARAMGVEQDPTLCGLARGLWPGLDLREQDATTLTLEPAERATLILANPPYTRHHHLDRAQKERIRRRVWEETGLRLSGLAGLHCAFLLLSRAWLAPDGVGAWLVPAETLDVNYGLSVRRFLREQVTLLRIHRADPAASLFSDAMVSSVILVFRNRPSRPGDEVELSYGGRPEAPLRVHRLPLEALDPTARWSALPAGAPAAGTPLGQLFTVRRGVATGANALFILDEARARGVPESMRVPILPGPRHLRVDRVEADAAGAPLLREPRWLLRCGLPEEALRREHPAVWELLRAGEETVRHRYLCRHRDPWYAQEHREPAPILCSYMGRGDRPFRFVLNRSRAIAPNTWLMLYPKPALQEALDADPTLLERVVTRLNALRPQDTGPRTYGGGLQKLEPGELAALVLPEPSDP